jgi:hypothetical protein
VGPRRCRRHGGRWRVENLCKGKFRSRGLPLRFFPRARNALARLSKRSRPIAAALFAEQFARGGLGFVEFRLYYSVRKYLDIFVALAIQK